MCYKVILLSGPKVVLTIKSNKQRYLLASPRKSIVYNMNKALAIILRLGNMGI